MATEHSWYSIIDGEDIQQGDFIDGCPVFFPDYNDSLLNVSPYNSSIEVEIRGEWQVYDVVVMSQSCDLENGKLKFVLVCPHWSLEELSEKDNSFRQSKIREEIRRGNRPNYHMLNACFLEERPFDIQVVDFRLAYTLPYDFLKRFANAQSKRARLLSPYREQLSQSFARFFMRVGLPKDIPSFR